MSRLGSRARACGITRDKPPALPRMLGFELGGMLAPVPGAAPCTAVQTAACEAAAQRAQEQRTRSALQMSSQLGTLCAGDVISFPNPAGAAAAAAALPQHLARVDDQILDLIVLAALPGNSGALLATSRRLRAAAHRVATVASPADPFALPLNAATRAYDLQALHRFKRLRTVALPRGDIAASDALQIVQDAVAQPPPPPLPLPLHLHPQVLAMGGALGNDEGDDDADDGFEGIMYQPAIFASLDRMCALPRQLARQSLRCVGAVAHAFAFGGVVHFPHFGAGGNAVLPEVLLATAAAFDARMSAPVVDLLRLRALTAITCLDIHCVAAVQSFQPLALLPDLRSLTVSGLSLKPVPDFPTLPEGCEVTMYITRGLRGGDIPDGNVMAMLPPLTGVLSIGLLAVKLHSAQGCSDACVDGLINTLEPSLLVLSCIIQSG